MTNCASCKKELGLNARVCPACGAPVADPVTAGMSIGCVIIIAIILWIAFGSVVINLLAGTR
jgi:hypothetical protein